MCYEVVQIVQIVQVVQVVLMLQVVLMVQVVQIVQVVRIVARTTLVMCLLDVVFCSNARTFKRLQGLSRVIAKCRDVAHLARITCFSLAIEVIMPGGVRGHACKAGVYVLS